MILALFMVIVVVVAVVLFVMWLPGWIESKFNQWQSKIEGKYEEVDKARNEVLSTTAKENREYENTTTQLARDIQNIHTSLQSLSDEAVKQVKNMADVIQPVLSMFRTPQTAGIQYAEAELEVLLKKNLGDGLYERKPRSLASGNDVVDFIIKLPDCVIPIDSKFPEAVYRAWTDAVDEVDAKGKWRLFRDALIKQLENTSKYIKPDVGTTDYALLFLPSDVIWQQAFLVNKWYGEENPILQRSQDISVFGCSPQTLLPYFGLLRLGLRNLRLSEDFKAVSRQIDQLKTSFAQFQKNDWAILGKHLRDAYNSFSSAENARGGYSALQRTIEHLTNLPTGKALPEQSDANRLPSLELEVEREAHQL